VAQEFDAQVQVPSPLVPSRRAITIAAVVFTVVTAAGMTWAKWWPYAHKTAHVLSTHALGGTSTLTGDAQAPPAPSWHAAWAFAASYFQSVWPALAAALVIAAAAEALLPRRWLARTLARGPRRLGGSTAGGLLAPPSMMCTCCTSPLAVMMRRRGVPPASALAYWIGNPTLNPAVLVFLAVVLPWQWVGVRLVGGLLLVFLVTALVARLDRGTVEPSWTEDAADEPMTPRAMTRRFGRALGRLSITLVPEYCVVVLLIGGLRGRLFPAGDQLAAWGVLGVVLFAVAGALFVIPTAGEIPIILGLLAAGLGTGPVGALLITLPALSLPSLVMVGRSFSVRTLAALFGAVVALGVASGTVLAAF
jgi:uncharacterized membrane protein YraQ (UPF0718 family)